jgi:NAD(P)-dependent dehydrogenase (short-subunit alcohol dehydrogenase family)
MAKTFEGKVVLVTGANSGIGEAIAVAFQQAGAQVCSGWGGERRHWRRRAPGTPTFVGFAPTSPMGAK